MTLDRPQFRSRDGLCLKRLKKYSSKTIPESYLRREGGIYGCCCGSRPGFEAKWRPGLIRSKTKKTDAQSWTSQRRPVTGLLTCLVRDVRESSRCEFSAQSLRSWAPWEYWGQLSLLLRIGPVGPRWTFACPGSNSRSRDRPSQPAPY